MVYYFCTKFILVQQDMAACFVTFILIIVAPIVLVAAFYILVAFTLAVSVCRLLTAFVGRSLTVIVGCFYCPFFSF